MFLTRSEYDRGVNTFSPEGRLFQVEYAIEAIKLGSTAVGIQTSEGVVLAVEKRITSSLLESSSIEKVLEIDRHIGCAMSGLVADWRTMIDHARVEAQLMSILRYHADPSGTFTLFDAKAIGSGSEGAQTELQEHYHKSLTLREAEILSLKVLKQVMEEKLNATNVQVATVTAAHGFKIVNDADLAELVSATV
ncbi:proteasome component pup2 [Irineochytrium annulatum]|nr:proteasome component pup2 [Irineochytrium annulatum]